MTLNIPAGMGLATFNLRIDGDQQPMACTLGVRTLSPPLAELHAGRLFEAFRLRILPQTHSGTRLDSVTLRVRQDDGSDLVYTSNLGFGTASGTAGAGAAQNLAYLVEKLTNRGGRRGVGRMFVPGVPEATVDTVGSIVGSTVTAFNASLVTFRSDLSAASPGIGGEPVIPVLFHGNTTTTTRSVSGNTTTITTVTGAAGPAPDDINTFVVDPVAATQRRRMR